MASLKSEAKLEDAIYEYMCSELKKDLSSGAEYDQVVKVFSDVKELIDLKLMRLKTKGY